MGADKVRRYYADPAKRACDDGSLEQWIAYRFGQRGFVGRQLSRMEVRIKRVLRLW